MGRWFIASVCSACDGKAVAAEGAGNVGGWVVTGICAACDGKAGAAEGVESVEWKGSVVGWQKEDVGRGVGLEAGSAMVVWAVALVRWRWLE